MYHTYRLDMFSCPTLWFVVVLTWTKQEVGPELRNWDLVEEDQVSVVIAPGIVLKMEWELFFVNREHLAQLSPYFRASFFFGGGQQNTRKHVEIKSLGPQQFHTLIELQKTLKEFQSMLCKLKCKYMIPSTGLSRGRPGFDSPTGRNAIFWKPISHFETTKDFYSARIPYDLSLGTEKDFVEKDQDGVNVRDLT